MRLSKLAVEEKEAEQKVQSINLRQSASNKPNKHESAKSAEQEKAQDDKATTAAAVTEVASNKRMTKSQARRAKQKAKAQALCRRRSCRRSYYWCYRQLMLLHVLPVSTTSQTLRSSKSATTAKG